MIASNQMKTIMFLLFALLLTGAAQSEVATPPLVHRVTDLTSTLDAQQVQALEAHLAAFESRKGAQFAVLLVPTTQPETIEQYGIRVAEQWKLGRKGVDDGALLLVAKDDHRLRIEVGYGLEGALNDATAKRIAAETITPFFKRGEYYAGIDAGLSAMMKVIDGEPLPPKRAVQNDKYDLDTLLYIAFGLVVVAGGILRALLGRFPAALVVGGGMGALAWLTVASLMMAVLAGFAAFMFVLLGGGRSFGGFGGGGGFSGGGFGGGGGGFGGGGASGSW